MTARSGKRVRSWRIVASGVALAASGLMAVPVSATATPQTTQRAYWHMEQPENGAVPDLEGGAALNLHGDASVYVPRHTCDPFTDPTCVPDPEPLWGDGHLELDGTGGYAERGPGLLRAEGSFTVTARARLHASPAPQDQTAFALPGATRAAALVRYDADSGRWQFEATHKDGPEATTTRAVAPGYPPADEGDGDHLALVYDAPAGEMRLYVNGGLAAAITDWYPEWDFSTVGVQVGRASVGSTGSESFAGALDEVRVFGGALDQDQITTVSQLASGESLESDGS